VSRKKTETKSSVKAEASTITRGKEKLRPKLDQFKNLVLDHLSQGDREAQERYGRTECPCPVCFMGRTLLREICGSDHSEPPDPRVPPSPPLNLLGHWITEGGSLVELVPTSLSNGHPYTGGLPGETPELFWDEIGHATSVQRNERKREYDLKVRVSPCG
jgi:hypothetical protein